MQDGQELRNVVRIAKSSFPISFNVSAHRSERSVLVQYA